MKRHLLISAALLGALAGHSQALKPTRPAGLPLDICAAKYGMSQARATEDRITSPMIGSGSNNMSSQLGKSAAPVTTVSWNLLCGSMNVNGMLVNHSRPLQYNADLNAVTFVHRKSDSYTTSPAVSSAAESGVIVAEVSTNWGTTWDSTMIWLDENQWGRYPQGAIYNPSSNTNLANAYIVGSGPTVSGNSFTGNFYTSKQLNAFTTSSSTAAGSQQFYSFSLGTYPPGQAAHGWSRNGFTSTRDGIVRSLGIVEGDYQGLATVRGFAVTTGTFNGTSFDWSVDTLAPDCYIDDDGEKHLSPDPQMAFNESGTIGYIVGLGAINGSTLANKSFQPIVYKMDKTLSSTPSWTLMNGIDFNDISMRPVIKSTYESQRGLAGLHLMGTDTVGVPFVDDYDITVDKDGKLHIGATLMSAFSDHPDSLEFISQFTTSINPTEQYKWRHTPGSRPYFYDFIGDGVSPWKYVLIDSLSSEGPSAAPGGDGFNDNPWDNGGPNGIKVNIDSRIQLGRTPAGDYITYSWSESDSAITNQQFKWNTFPNIKVRMMEILPGPVYVVNSGQEQDITKGYPSVFTRATLHYMSPTSSSATLQANSVNSHTMDVKMPFTVTNSSPYSQTTNNSTYYGQANLSFTFTSALVTGIAGAADNNALSALIYPNPASNNVNIEIVSQDNNTAHVHLANALGQRLSTIKKDVAPGKNNLSMNLAGLSAGIYLVTIEVDGQQSTKKLVIE